MNFIKTINQEQNWCSFTFFLFPTSVWICKCEVKRPKDRRSVGRYGEMKTQIYVNIISSAINQCFWPVVILNKKHKTTKLFFFVLFFNFIFKLYSIVLVLPNIEMNPPQVYLCSPSWNLLPPPSPYPPSESFQCTSPKLSKYFQ